MKKLLLPLAIVALVAYACQQGPVRYTQNSPEIDTIKKLISNYNAKNFDASMFADTSKTYYNTKDNPMSAEEAMTYHKENDNNYASRGFLSDHQEYEMVLTDDGESWVNCWLDWKGTLKANGKEVVIPIHLTYQFVDGKIVREYGYWDPTEIVLTLQQLEAEAVKTEQEETE
ncbi:nuclear transport factor 2 family protein [Flagellimonas allohymeniacidonis]|uniref:Nuclear transport factor 2 family protein n=1 Tax=Flagellimonas allohymeniacidonis TaxID=2517819 RepID=A0A4Q8QIX1_9FLAO|nr:nuclear transport factor 2 family protein [Allomuricauda hymeniacidonis]TAI49228.1 nuclear transport factor 2 family protein [Allomuricauda hymeniacidonis]